MELLAFPAVLTRPDGTTTRPVKAYRDAGDVVIFAAIGRTIVEVVRAPAPDGLRVARPFTLVAADGTEWSLRPVAGCGCGHPLKRWQPDRQPRRVGA